MMANRHSTLFAKRAEVMASECPLCKAAAGAVCRSMTLPGAPGLRRNRVHHARVAAVITKIMEASKGLCPNCESEQHVRCCQRCGTTVPDPRRAFCSQACVRAQETADRISDRQERNLMRRAVGGG